ncbi:N-acetylmuramic acid 6-phosphate etherase [Acetobacter nitrogenifigens DSM 23921 = NBRC 105050]|nr:N-acetylmuramic acid 6-phosphate etherase [Acetobacter nitrogenifigens DSM 23921 = NBRC 105050]
MGRCREPTVQAREYDLLTNNDARTPSALASADAATERRDERFADIDLWSTGSILSALGEAQMAATAVAYAAAPQIEAVVDAALPGMRNGGRLFYVGAGTSGRVGLQDGVELTPTFGLPPERLVLLLAGGAKALFEAVEGAEDREDIGRADVLEHDPGPDDLVIGVAASGRTPYTCSAVRAAREKGALTVGVSSSPQGKLLQAAAMSIVLSTGPEVISGSTRLKAGTAQKAALNMLSTALMIRLGHAYRGQMVDMRIVNAKLRVRAIAMVRRLAGGTDAEIEAALAASGDNVKRAVMIRKGIPVAEITARLEKAGGDLRRALGERA